MESGHANRFSLNLLSFTEADFRPDAANLGQAQERPLIPKIRYKVAAWSLTFVSRSDKPSLGILFKASLQFLTKLAKTKTLRAACDPNDRSSTLKLNRFNRFLETETPEVPPMQKTIVIFNDGTGQHLNSRSPSNISKLFRLLAGAAIPDGEADSAKFDEASNQYSFYIRGVGTEDLRKLDGSKDRFTWWQKLWNALGDRINTTAEQVTGTAIKDRIERTLKIVEKTWSPGDRVIFVGFSRGAASARIAAFELRKILPEFVLNYLLIFDTVYSVFGEVQIRDGMKIKRFEDLELPAHIERCDHLVAGDEMRDMFPVTPINKRQGMRQILFPGSHSDVGGGNPSTALSDISLEFAIREMRGHGARFIDPVPAELQPKPDPAALITWDRFNGIGQTHFPRDFQNLHFCVHSSVFTRANSKKSVSIALAQLTQFRTTSQSELVKLEEIDSSFDL